MIVAERDHRQELWHEQSYTPQTKKRNISIKKRQLKKGHYILMIFFVGIIVLSIVSRYSNIIERQYRIEKLESEIRTMEYENEVLKVKIADLKSVSRIEKLARTKLNMQEPSNKQIIYLRED